jgi:hypothetical protein
LHIYTANSKDTKILYNKINEKKKHTNTTDAQRTGRALKMLQEEVKFANQTR